MHVYMKDKFIDIHVHGTWNVEFIHRKQIQFKLPLSYNNQIKNNFCCSQDEN